MLASEVMELLSRSLPTLPKLYMIPPMRCGYVEVPGQRLTAADVSASLDSPVYDADYYDIADVLMVLPGAEEGLTPLTPR